MPDLPIIMSRICFMFYLDMRPGDTTAAWRLAPVRGCSRGEWVLDQGRFKLSSADAQCLAHDSEKSAPCAMVSPGAEPLGAFDASGLVVSGFGCRR